MSIKETEFQIQKTRWLANNGSFESVLKTRNNFIEKLEKAEKKKDLRAVQVYQDEIPKLDEKMDYFISLHLRADWKLTDEMKAFTSYTKLEQSVVEETPSAPSKDFVFAVLEKLQSGNALSQTEEDILKKIKDAKTGDNLATYRSNFITKTFRHKYEGVVSVLELQGQVTCEWALEEIGCNAWFNEFVLRSIIGNCKGRGKFANRFRGHTVEKKKRRDESLRTSVEIEEGATDALDALVWHLVVLPKK